VKTDALFYKPLQPWRALVFYPNGQIERTIKAALPFLDLPNLRRIYFDELPLLESSNPKLWLIALLVADVPQLPAIVEKVKAYKANNPSDGVDWIELLETLLICKLPDITREEIQTMFGLREIDLKHTRVYQDAVKEGHLEGHIKGRMEGRTHGRPS
jgi:predicted transposase YdaD